jgi:uncharacterized Tic20 family protein
MAQLPSAQKAPALGPSGVPPEQERTWAVVAHVDSFLAAYVVLVILASVAASRGQLYRYPVSLRLVR